jgi:hypothetical protein
LELPFAVGVFGAITFSMKLFTVLPKDLIATLATHKGGSNAILFVEFGTTIITVVL